MLVLSVMLMVLLSCGRWQRVLGAVETAAVGVVVPMTSCGTDVLQLCMNRCLPDVT